jgi:hypothetical protein
MRRIFFMIQQVTAKETEKYDSLVSELPKDSTRVLTISTPCGGKK